MARILVVDDDSEVREMLHQMLERAGYQVLDAANGEEATRIYKAQPTDVIITDIIMPEREGIETIVALRNQYPTVKIIAISGGGRLSPRGYLDLAKKLGARFTFTKPIDRRKLLEAVESLLHEA